MERSGKNAGTAMLDIYYIDLDVEDSSLRPKLPLFLDIQDCIPLSGLWPNSSSVGKLS